MAASFSISIWQKAIWASVRHVTIFMSAIQHKPVISDKLKYSLQIYYKRYYKINTY